MPSPSSVDLGNIYTIPGLSAGSLNADFLASMDVSQWDWITVYVGSSAYSGQLSIQGTNDPNDSASWKTCQMFWADGLSIANIVIDSLTYAAQTGPRRYPYLRVRMTAYTSGTAIGSVELRRGSSAMTLSSSYAILLGSAGTNIGKADSVSPYPYGAVPQTASSGNIANASAVATLAHVTGHTTYITGFEITGSGASSALPVIVTVTGLVTGTLSYIYSAAAGVLVENTPLIIPFDTAVPASAINTDIVVTCPALGTGNTNNAVNARGYTL